MLSIQIPPFSIIVTAEQTNKILKTSENLLKTPLPGGSLQSQWFITGETAHKSDPARFSETQSPPADVPGIPPITSRPAQTSKSRYPQLDLISHGNTQVL